MWINAMAGVANYLHRWGVKLKAAGKRPIERCATGVQEWLESRYPEIEQQAREKGAVIHWINKAEKVDSALWSKATATHKKMSLLSVVNNQGRMSWIVIEGSFNAERQIQLMNGLMRENARKKIVIIRPDWKMCGSKKFERWLIDNREKIQMFPSVKDGPPIKRRRSSPRGFSSDSLAMMD
jgi:hypothetical protein